MAVNIARSRWRRLRRWREVASRLVEEERYDALPPDRLALLDALARLPVRWTRSTEVRTAPRVTGLEAAGSRVVARVARQEPELVLVRGDGSASRVSVR